MQNQHRINYQPSYFGNTVFYVVESVGSIADNVKRLCDGGFYTQSFFKTAIAKPVLQGEANSNFL